MSYLGNSNINKLNLNASILKLVDSVAWIFGPLYFYELGYEIYQVLIIAVCYSITRIAFRISSLYFIRKFSLRTILAIGCLGKCAAPLIFIQIGENPNMIALYVLLGGMCGSIYWTCYHIFYAVSGDDSARGRQVAVAMALSSLVSALYPFISAVFIEKYGFVSYFYIMIPLAISGVTSILWCKDIKITPPEINYKNIRKQFATFGAKSHSASVLGWDAFFPTWIFMVYFAVGDMSEFGLILTIGILAKAIIELMLGKFFDKGSHWMIFKIGVFGSIFCFIAMAFMPLNIYTILTFETLFAFATTFKIMGFFPLIYNDSTKAKDIGSYWFASETMVDVASITVRVPMILLLMAGTPLNYLLLLGVVGYVITYFVVKPHSKQLDKAKMPGEEILPGAVVRKK